MLENKYLSLEELKILNEKLEKLKSEEKPKILNELNKARSLGDLSENSEYQSAKRKIFLLENKIKDIENVLSNCNIKSNKKLSLSLIELKDLKTNKIFKYKITDNKNNESKKIISIDSPIVNLIKNKKVNDIIKIKRYNKEILFMILKIK